MGLHNTIAHGWKSVILWYQAVNDRGGRYHLWRVPAFQHDKTRIQNSQERLFSYYREEMLNHDQMGFSEFLDENPPSGAQRLCNMQQNAHRWSRRWGWAAGDRLAPIPSETPPRGWCRQCWPIYLKQRTSIVYNSNKTAMYASSRSADALKTMQDLTVLSDQWQEQIDSRA